MSPTVPSDTLRWGFIGASRIAAARLAPAVRAEPGQDIVAIGARTAERARAFAARFGVPHAHATYADVVGRKDVDAVYISLRNDAHVDWAVAALEAGKHVLCEKPLAMNAVEVGRMVDAARANGKVLMEAICSDFHPQYDAMDAIMADGAIGDLVSLEARFAAVLDDPADFRWQAAHGGGALYDIGCYCVAMLHRIAGRFPERVAARMRMRRGVDVSLQALADFGAFSATITCSFDAGTEQQITIAGTGGRITLMRPYSAIEQAMSIIHDGRTTDFGPMNPYRAMIAHFRDGVVNGAPVRHGVDVVRGQAATLDALFRAARSDRFETVERQGGPA